MTYQLDGYLIVGFENIADDEKMIFHIISDGTDKSIECQMRHILKHKYPEWQFAQWIVGDGNGWIYNEHKMA